MTSPQKGRGWFVAIGVVALCGVVLFAAPWWPGCRLASTEVGLRALGVLIVLGSAILGFLLVGDLHSGTSHANLAAKSGAVAVAMFLIGSIGIPGLVGAIDRGHQKRTMGDIRAIASALESYFAQHHRYPPVSRGEPLDDLAAQLAPTHVG